MALVDELIEANDRFAVGFDAGDLPSPPRRRVVVLTCMDSRLHPEDFLGFGMGDAHVIRNAGGRASPDAIRSLVISSRELGTRRLVVIHHTDCGMLTLTNEDLRTTLREDAGVDATDIDFLPFSDLEGSVREDVETIVSSPLLASGLEVSGFVYDVETGRIRQVVDTVATAGPPSDGASPTSDTDLTDG
ncbi:MAG TPA: carbonic anhydrase [Nitriliruptorales bacterium]|nr:carbonic anhydrase [Nitriliruptorales bacterium]